jgi:hypothetical protein
MKPESSSPCSQVPATCPYLEPDQTSSRPFHCHLFKSNINIILPSTLGSAKWCLSLRVSHQNPVFNSLFPVRATSHSSWFDHPNSDRWGVHFMKPLTAIFSSPSQDSPLPQPMKCSPLLCRQRTMNTGTFAWLLFLLKQWNSTRTTNA